MRESSLLLLCLAALATSADSFGGKPSLFHTSTAVRSSVDSSSSSSSSTKTWQEDLDQVLNVDTACDNRRELLKGLASRASDIASEVQGAIQSQDTSKIAPESLPYGRALANLRRFQQQLVTDIIPDILTRGVPKLIEDGPELLRELTAKGPDGLIKSGTALFTQLQDMTTDASLLQSTKDDLLNELKNVVKSTPIGLETPQFDIISTKEGYEIRSYAPYTVCSTTVNSEDDMMDPIARAKSFNVLASYIFGENSQDQKMAMTVPVISDASEKTMKFVLPSYMKALTAPFPSDQSISLVDVARDTVASREFSGLATEGEVSRQRALLEDSLIFDGVVYESSSFRVLQYNPPQTLPWLRKNEVSFRVTLPTVSDTSDVTDSSASSSAGAAATGSATLAASAMGDSADEDSGVTSQEKKSTFNRAGAKTDDEDTFFTSPEAGD